MRSKSDMPRDCDKAPRWLARKEYSLLTFLKVALLELLLDKKAAHLGMMHGVWRDC